MILDTTFLIDLLRNDAAAIAKSKELDSSPTPLSITTITLFELWRGVSSADPAKATLMMKVLETYHSFDLDHSSAKTAGTIAYELDRLGKPIDSEDCMIAGIALEHKQPILTRNAEHFKRIAKLVVQEY